MSQSDESAAPNSSAPSLPHSLQLAGEMVNLEAFLEDAALGFHWDLLDRMEEGVYFVDQHRRVMYWSQGAEQIAGYRAAEVLGKRCADNILCHVNGRGVCLCKAGCPLRAVMDDGQPRGMEVFLHHKDGHRVPVRVFGAPIRNSQGEIIGAFETFSDATARAGDLERIHNLQDMAFLDQLTGIPNRRFLDRQLSVRFEEMQREGRSFGLIMLDIDYFKTFNDTYGHDVGDRILRMVAQTLTRACRSYDLAARWGGEEFVVLTGRGDEEAVASLAERLRSLVEQSNLTHEGVQLGVTVSLGATFAVEADDADSLLRRADRLLYQSKEAGRNRLSFAA